LELRLGAKKRGEEGKKKSTKVAGGFGQGLGSVELVAADGAETWFRMDLHQTRQRAPVP
jgi:hypothetical protein